MGPNGGQRWAVSWIITTVRYEKLDIYRAHVTVLDQAQSSIWGVPRGLTGHTCGQPLSLQEGQRGGASSVNTSPSRCFRRCICSSLGLSLHSLVIAFFSLGFVAHLINSPYTLCRRISIPATDFDLSYPSHIFIGIHFAYPSEDKTAVASFTWANLSLGPTVRLGTFPDFISHHGYGRRSKAHQGIGGGQ